MRPRILIVEDSDLCAAVTIGALKANFSTSIECFRVASIAEAKEWIISESPDIIVLDLTLSDSDGLDTIDHIRMVAPFTPIVALTGSFGNEHAVLAMGASKFVKKTQMDMLPQAILHAIDEYRRRSEARRETINKLDSLVSLNKELVMKNRNHESRITAVEGVVNGTPGNPRGLAQIVHDHEVTLNVLSRIAWTALAAAITTTIAVVGSFWRSFLRLFFPAVVVCMVGCHVQESPLLHSSRIHVRAAAMVTYAVLHFEEAPPSPPKPPKPDNGKPSVLVPASVEQEKPPGNFEVTPIRKPKAQCLIFSASWCGPCQALKRNVLFLRNRGWTFGQNGDIRILEWDNPVDQPLFRSCSPDISAVPVAMITAAGAEECRLVGNKIPFNAENFEQWLLSCSRGEWRHEQ